MEQPKFIENRIGAVDEPAALDRSRRSPVQTFGELLAPKEIAREIRLEQQAVREPQQVMEGLGYMRTGKGARIEQISRDVRVMVGGGGSEEVLTELAFTQERRDLKSYVK